MDSASIIATWMVVDDEPEAYDFPQSGANSADPQVQAIYWRCVVAFFASSRRAGNDCRHLFYTNAERLPDINGVAVSQMLSKFGVEVRVRPITHRLGRERAARWNNQFYILDIINDLIGADFSRVVVLDADCAWVRTAARLFRDIDRREILTLCIPYPAEAKVNGASRNDLRRASERLGNPVMEDPHYCGGEIFAATRAGVEKVHAMAGPMWRILKEAKPGEIDVFEEGHLLSIIYERLDIPIGTADAHIRRMLTAMRFSNVSWEDIFSSRCIWHLPEEKSVGFDALYQAAVDENSWLWACPPDALPSRMAAAMGLPKRSVRQWLTKFAQRSTYFASKRILPAR